VYLLSPVAGGASVRSPAVTATPERRGVGDVVRWAVVGTLVCLVLVGLDVRGTGATWLNLVQPGQAGPSLAVIEEDFPDVEVPAGDGLDGQQFYVMARDPLHLEEHAEHLDRPRYRWQRPLYPWLAWALHPSGGGDGLVVALLVVGVAGVLRGGVATGLLGRALGAGPWTAVLFGLLPGSYYSLRVSVADALALALAVAALALERSGRPRLAVTAGAAAVLGKEATGLVLLGWLLARPRSGTRQALVVVPALVGAAWFVAVRLLLPDAGGSVGELAAPFTGWWSAVTERWLDGDELLGMASSVSAAVAGVVVLVRDRLRHPLGPVVAVHLAFTVVVNGDVLGMDFGGTRSQMALLLFAVLELVTPGAGAAQSARTLTSPSHGAAGLVGPGAADGGSSKA